MSHNPRLPDDVTDEMINYHFAPTEYPSWYGDYESLITELQGLKADAEDAGDVILQLEDLIIDAMNLLEILRKETDEGITA